MSNNAKRMNTIREKVKQSTIEYLVCNIEVDKEVCGYFGCGRTLSPQESLYGSRCPFHQNEKRIIDLVDKVIKYK